jgi:hypothetical protein
VGFTSTLARQSETLFAGKSSSYHSIVRRKPSSSEVVVKADFFSLRVKHPTGGAAVRPAWHRRYGAEDPEGHQWYFATLGVSGSER